MATKPAKKAAKRNAKKTTKKTATKPAAKAPDKAPAAKPARAAPAADPGMSDAAVERATGRTWDGWLTLLDKAGAAKMKHPEIALLLHEEHGVGDWWAQMVTVGYERARGLREKHQTPGGYQISASKTIAVSLGRLFDAWNDDASRRRWLPEAVTIRRATPGKSLRVTWSDGATNVDVNLYAKGDSKSLVTLQHSKLANTTEAERLKALWAERLGVLKEQLEG